MLKLVRKSPRRTLARATSSARNSYLELNKQELESVALESTRTIDVTEFVPREEIDDLYIVRPYYIVPDGKVGHDAFAVIRETIRSMDNSGARCAHVPRACHST